jgi:tryptophan synthase alpha chain
MSRIPDIFKQLHVSKRPGVMPFITGGFPSLRDTEAALPALDRAGASIVEIGIPFSDPIADGPVIAESMHAALQRGTTPAAIFEIVQKLRPDLRVGLIAMVSASIVLRIGERKFIRQAAECGIDGLIVPDADTDAGGNSPGGRLAQLAADRDLTCSFLVAPTTSPERLRTLASLSSGFIYLLARLGITGERAEAPEVEQHVARVRAVTDLPIAVGFGISSPQQARAVIRHADAVIVGSALVRRMGESQQPVVAAEEFTRSIVDALRPREAEL